jgi:Na+-translocating ferredoxin:NAD+ oxidoreductase RnfA subunit
MLYLDLLKVLKPLRIKYLKNINFIIIIGVFDQRRKGLMKPISTGITKKIFFAILSIKMINIYAKLDYNKVIYYYHDKNNKEKD